MAGPQAGAIKGNTVKIDVNNDGLLDDVTFDYNKTARQVSQCHFGIRAKHKALSSTQCTQFIKEQAAYTSWQSDITRIDFHPETKGANRFALERAHHAAEGYNTCTSSIYVAGSTSSTIDPMVWWDPGLLNARVLYHSFHRDLPQETQQSLKNQLKETVENSSVKKWKDLFATIGREMSQHVPDQNGVHHMLTDRKTMRRLASDMHNLVSKTLSREDRSFITQEISEHQYTRLPWNLSINDLFGDSALPWELTDAKAQLNSAIHKAFGRPSSEMLRETTERVAFSRAHVFGQSSSVALGMPQLVTLKPGQDYVLRIIGPECHTNQVQLRLQSIAQYSSPIGLTLKFEDQEGQELYINSRSLSNIQLKVEGKFLTLNQDTIRAYDSEENQYAPASLNIRPCEDSCVSYVTIGEMVKVCK